MERFSRTKKNTFLPIRDAIEEALSEIKNLRREMVWCDSYLLDFEWNPRYRMLQRIKVVSLPKKKDDVEEGTQTPLQPASRPPLDTCKQLREPTAPDLREPGGVTIKKYHDLSGTRELAIKNHLDLFDNFFVFRVAKHVVYL